jgi:hypothetical protein
MRQEVAVAMRAKLRGIPHTILQMLVYDCAWMPRRGCFGLVGSGRDLHQPFLLTLSIQWQRFIGALLEVDGLNSTNSQ